MNAAEVFAAMCRAIWPDDAVDFYEAAQYLGVRHSTTRQWASGRRAFDPHVLQELEKLAKIRATALAGALGILEQYRETL